MSTKLVNLVRWKLGVSHPKAVEVIATVKERNGGVLRGLKKAIFLRMIKECVSDQNENLVYKVAKVEKESSKKWKKTCKFCYKIFFSNQTRDRHIKKVHSDDQELLSEGEVDEPGDLPSEEIVTNGFEHCEKLSDRFKCKDCGKTFSHSVSLKRHTKEHEEKPESFECDQDGCKFKTLRKDSYWKHRRQVHHFLTLNFERLREKRGASDITCIVCEKSFAESSAFEDHIIHKTCQNSAENVNEEGRHECNQCSCSYTNKCSLAKHIEWKHKQMQGFDCKKCGITLSTPSSLRRHERKHNSE